MNQIQLLDEKETAKILSISVQTLRNNRLLSRGLDYHKVGRSVRYLMQDIIEYIKKTKVHVDNGSIQEASEQR